MLRFKKQLLVYLFKALLTVLVIMVPLLGVWFASSLAAYLDGPTWLVVLSGLLFFPILPLLWDWRSTVKWRQKCERDEATKTAGQAELSVDEFGTDSGDTTPRRILTFWDRLILRTLAINLALLIALGWLFPEEGFTALSARGDWMLDGVDGAWTEPVERALFTSAGGLEFLYHAAHENPYERYADDDVEAPDSGERGELPKAEDRDDSSSDEADEQGRKALSWPPPDDLHPAVVDMPPSAERSIESVAAYIAERESDPYYRVKALYDFVTDRLSYDVEVLDALRAGERHYPPQDAESVFERRIAVCAGYARLMVELGRETGDQIVYVTGVSRQQDGEISGLGHAWNAARIEGQWYLLDPTWGAGHVDPEQGFVSEYNPTYLFTPPEIMINTHFPDEKGWQLLSEPLSRGEFVRQPQLRPAFFANDMELIEPTRSQTSVGSQARVVLRNEKRRHIVAHLAPMRGGTTTDCDVTGGDETVVTCPIPRAGRYQVMLFGSQQRYGSMPLWGKIEVQGS